MDQGEPIEQGPGLLTPVDPSERGPSDGRGVEEGIGLALSGGGSRALLFHTGALIRLGELGLLRRLARISSVSGGTLAAAILAVAWPDLEWDAHDRPTNLREVYVPRVRALASTTVDVPVFLRGALWRGSIAQALADRFARDLVGDRTLQDLPSDDDPAHPAPRFVINASNLQSTAVFRFSRPYAGDYRIGRIANPTIRLADAVAASCAFPPFFGPLTLDLRPYTVVADPTSDLSQPPYTERAVLVDGGVYDNLGLETIYKRFRTLLVSNGGGQTGADPAPKTDWARQTLRVMNLLDHQVRSLRARMLIGAFERQPPDRLGAYWGLRTSLASYDVPGRIDFPAAEAARLAALPTRLAKVDPAVQVRLIDWGYAICDASVRRRMALPNDPEARLPSKR